jgi:hypothetical protein
MLEVGNWFCDTCGEPIETIEDGWIEWIDYQDSEGNTKGRDFRLVHVLSASPYRNQREHGCHFDEQAEFKTDQGSVSDLPLESFLGADGLMFLLSKIDEGIISVAELLEMIKRLHIPGYEQARRHFDRALREGVIEQNMYPGYYTQEDISRVLRQG